jgi:hypothetical protein
MVGERGPNVLCFDTAKKSQDEIVENLLIQLSIADYEEKIVG